MTRRVWLTFGIALVVALAAAVWNGVTVRDARSFDEKPRPSIQAKLGESVTVDGMEFVVEEKVVAAALPKADDGELVSAMPGAVWVLVRYRVQPPTPRPSPSTCVEQLIAEFDGHETIWDAAASGEGFPLLPDENAATCLPKLADPSINSPTVRSVIFQIPQTVANDVQFRVGLLGGQTLLQSVD